MVDLETSCAEPYDARIDTVLALLNLRAEYASRGAELVFARTEISELLKLNGDPWICALLAELSEARRRAERIATHTPYARIVMRLVGKAQDRQTSARLMRRAVNRPLDAAMLRAQDLLARLQTHSTPLNPSAKHFLYAQLLGIQRAWAHYGDLMLQAYIQLINQHSQPCPAPAAEALARPRPQAQQQALFKRRRSDQEPMMH